MENYFRITAYDKEKDTSAILDCNGKFEKCWQFSSFLVIKGFQIIAVGDSQKFTDGNLQKVNFNNKQVILRACCKGQPIITGETIKVGDKYYTATNL